MAKGLITRVSSKENAPNKFGKSWKIGIQLDEVDTWYNISFAKKDAEALGLVKGRVVSFEYSTDDYGNKIDPKTIEVSREAAPAKAAASGGAPAGKSWSGEKGVKVGHAINNAVQLAIASGDLELKNIHKFAVNILTLSVKLEGQYEAIIAKATDKAEPAPAPATDPAPAKPATKPKAAPKKAEPAPAPEADAFEDDDIPF